MNAVFGQRLSRQIFDENHKDAAAGITGQQIRSNWQAVCREIDRIPSVESLLKAYQVLGVKSSLSDIQVSDDMEQRLLDESPMVRNRLTLMRIRRCLG